MLQIDQYTVVPAPPDEVWRLVGDLSRLTEWTDATATSAGPPPYAPKDTFTVHADGDDTEWMVITADEGLLEVKTTLPRGRLGLGVRVGADPTGSRLILAALYDPVGSRLRARLVEVPALRRRFDRWTENAVRALQRR